jgi:hypothetical protein
VTVKVTEYIPAAVGVQEIGSEELVAHPGGRAQAKVYPPEPPLTVEENETPWVRSTEGVVTVVAPAVGALSTVKGRALLPTLYPFESVTFTTIL